MNVIGSLQLSLLIVFRVSTPASLGRIEKRPGLHSVVVISDTQELVKTHLTVSHGLFWLLGAVLVVEVLFYG